MLYKIKAIILILAFSSLNAQTLIVNPLYNTIGVSITNIDNVDSCLIEYKQKIQGDWLKAFPPDKITLNGSEQYRGALFNLLEATNYDIKATVYKRGISNVLPIQQMSTLQSPSFATTSNIKWVSPNGTGNYTQSSPGNLASLFTSGQVTCGTTIMFMDGVYSANNLQLNIANDCTDNTPILLTAAPGTNPIIDGGIMIKTPWTAHPTISNLYSTNIPSTAKHSDICVIGQTSLYPYPTLFADPLFGNYNLSNLNFGYDGFVRDENTIWIKTKAGINPNDSIVNVSMAWRFLTVYGNNKKAFLKIKDLTFKHFGKPELTAFGSSQDAYGAMAFDFRNAHNIYFDNCQFIFNVANINFASECNSITIQNTYFKSDAGKWSHAMLKKSHSNSFFISTSRGRSFETEAIFLDKGKSICIRNNYFDGPNSGVQSYTEQGLKEDVDINNNIFIDVFDAVENDGQWANLKVWNNEFIRPMSAFSAAPPLIGPRYFYRNLIHGLQGRRNEADDPYFTSCIPVTNNFMLQSIALKTNPIYTGTIPKGNIYLFNNTIHSEDTLGFVFTSWEAEWRKAIFMNNSFSHAISYPFFFFNLADKISNGKFQLTSQNDNYFSYNNKSSITKVKYIHGQYNCTEIYNVSDLQNTLSNISASPNIIIQNPLQTNPLFENTNTGGFNLKNNSPLIDAGVLIQGFYDFKGIVPDIGAKESNSTTVTEDYQSNKISIYPNPVFDFLNIKLPKQSENANIKVFNNLGVQVITLEHASGNALKIKLNQLPDGIYFIEIKSPSINEVKKILKTSY